jgi:hypothetical protein
MTAIAARTSDGGHTGSSARRLPASAPFFGSLAQEARGPSPCPPRSGDTVGDRVGALARQSPDLRDALQEPHTSMSVQRPVERSSYPICSHFSCTVVRELFRQPRYPWNSSVSRSSASARAAVANRFLLAWTSADELSAHAKLYAYICVIRSSRALCLQLSSPFSLTPRPLCVLHHKRGKHEASQPS